MGSEVRREILDPDKKDGLIWVKKRKLKAEESVTFGSRGLRLLARRGRRNNRRDRGWERERDGGYWGDKCLREGF